MGPNTTALGSPIKWSAKSFSGAPPSGRPGRPALVFRRQAAAPPLPRFPGRPITLLLILDDLGRVLQLRRPPHRR